MQPHTPEPPAPSRRKRSRHGLAAMVLAGLMIGAPVSQAFASPTSSPTTAPSTTSTPSSSTTNTTNTTENGSWLKLQVDKGQDTSWKAVGLTGGVWWVEVGQLIGEGGSAAPDATVKVTVDGEAIPSALVSTGDGSITPKAGGGVAGLTSKESGGKTVITVTSTAERQVFYILPKTPPRAADPKNQENLDSYWRQVLAWVTGDDTDEQNPADQTSNPSGTEVEPSKTSQPSASPTSSGSQSSSSTASSRATSTPSSEPTGNDGTTSSSTTTPSGTPTGSPTDATDQPEGSAGPEPEDTSGEKSSTRCVFTSSEADSEDSRTGTLEAGPTAAPTFSDETRAKVLNQGACNPSPSASSSTATSGAAPADGDENASGGSSSSTLKLTNGDWYSGASGDPARRDALASARGSDLEIATSWQWGGSSAITMDVLKGDAEYSKSNWNGKNKALIMSVSSFDTGGSWDSAAAGAYDENWRKQASNAKAGWGDREGDFIVSFDWELNGSWFPWGAKKGQEETVKKALNRQANIWAEEFPAAYPILTFNYNSNGYDGNSMNLWPGGKFKGLGWDGYNHWPHITTEAQWDDNYMAKDGGGGPQGDGAWLAAAKAEGVTGWQPEWNNDPQNGGESEVYMKRKHEFFADNAGPNPGQFAGEVVFIADIDGGNWSLGSDSHMPKTAKAYADAFSDVGTRTSRNAGQDDTMQDSSPTSPSPTASSPGEPTATPTGAPAASDPEGQESTGQESATAQLALVRNGTTKVMAAGDSIIDNGSGGVRTALSEKLSADGISVDWVGPYSGGPSELKDQDHAGTSGILVKELKNKVGAWVSTYRPDIVYLDAGRNDEMWGGADTVAGDYRDMLANICAANPKVTVLAALNHAMGPGARDDGAERVLQDLNPAITQAASAAREDGCNVLTIDLSKVITADLRADDVHPNQAGFAAEAEVVYPVLKKVLTGSATGA